MDFYDVIHNRYSVRSYKPIPVEDETLARILEAGRLAPTAANRQSFRIIVIHTEDRRSELARIYGKEWFTQAPLVLCLCGIPEENWVRRDGKNFNDIDMAIVMDHMILAAAAEGLGTCWIGAFDPDAAREILEIPDYAVPVLFTPLGYPADRAAEKKRKEKDELVRYERW
jgi:nitroreductase